MPDRSDTPGPRRFRRLAAFAIGAMALGIAACGAGTGARPNVLLITVDTLRPDRLSCYGYAERRTPNIDRLAAEGALFENAFADTPWTTPSMSSVMTGVYPTLHGFKSMSTNRLGLEQVTLSEILRERGYATAAVIGSFPLDAIYQLDQGFEVYDEDFTAPILILPDHQAEHLPSEFYESPQDQRLFILAKAANDSRREDPAVTDAAARWLREGRAEPFFLWVHYFGAHDKPDWRIPESQRDRRRLARYDPDVQVSDREVGRLLDLLDREGLAASTLVVFHADHGESLGEQVYLGHGQLLNEASMRIPLILRHPGTVAAGLRVERLARNVDILPTVVDAAGAPVEGEVSGESLLPLVRPAPLRWLSSLCGRGRSEPVAYMETYYPAHYAFARPVILPDGTKAPVGMVRRGLRTRRWKFVRTEPHVLLDVGPDEVPEVPEDLRNSVRREELYDLSAPSGEAADVAAEHPRVADQLRAVLDAQLEAERRAAGAPRMEADEETRLRLRSLGYGD